MTVPKAPRVNFGNLEETLKRVCDFSSCIVPVVAVGRALQRHEIAHIAAKRPDSLCDACHLNSANTAGHGHRKQSSLGGYEGHPRRSATYGFGARHPSLPAPLYFKPKKRKGSVVTQMYTSARQRPIPRREVGVWIEPVKRSTASMRNPFHSQPY